MAFGKSIKKIVSNAMHPHQQSSSQAQDQSSSQQQQQQQQQGKKSVVHANVAQSFTTAKADSLEAPSVGQKSPSKLTKIARFFKRRSSVSSSASSACHPEPRKTVEGISLESYIPITRSLTVSRSGLSASLLPSSSTCFDDAQQEKSGDNAATAPLAKDSRIKALSRSFSLQQLFQRNSCAYEIFRKRRTSELANKDVEGVTKQEDDEAAPADALEIEEKAATQEAVTDSVKDVSLNNEQQAEEAADEIPKPVEAEVQTLFETESFDMEEEEEEEEPEQQAPEQPQQQMEQENAFDVAIIASEEVEASPAEQCFADMSELPFDYHRNGSNAEMDEMIIPEMVALPSDATMMMPIASPSSAEFSHNIETQDIQSSDMTEPTQKSVDDYSFTVDLTPSMPTPKQIKESFESLNSCSIGKVSSAAVFNQSSTNSCCSAERSRLSRAPGPLVSALIARFESSQ